MQNEPNSQKPKITLIPFSVMTYEKITLSNDPKNEPNSNPNQTQFMLIPFRENFFFDGIFASDYPFSEKSTKAGESENDLQAGRQ
jgi:hypothetical protein